MQVLLTLSLAAAMFPGADAYKPVERVMSDAAQHELQAELLPYQGKAWRMNWQQDYPTIEVSLKGQPVGTVVQVEEIGKHKLITFGVGIKADSAVQGVEVLAYRENYGGKIKEAKFLDQYRGKRWKDKIDTPGDIDAVSGATYSSFATNRAVRKALGALKVLSHEKK